MAVEVVAITLEVTHIPLMCCQSIRCPVNGHKYQHKRSPSSGISSLHIVSFVKPSSPFYDHMEDVQGMSAVLRVGGRGRDSIPSRVDDCEVKTSMLISTGQTRLS